VARPQSLREFEGDVTLEPVGFVRLVQHPIDPFQEIVDRLIDLLGSDAGVTRVQPDGDDRSTP
jgi:hypothetical protein